MNIAWPITKITRLLHIELPIIQAPMAGGVTTPALVAAVSNAGGLGSLGAGYMSAAEIKNNIQEIRALTDKPFAVNLFIPEKHRATDEQMERARRAVQTSCAALNVMIDSVKPPYSPSFEAQMEMIIDEKVPIFSFTFGVPSESWIKIFKKNNIILIGTATSLEEALYLEKNGVDVIVAQGSEAGGHRGTFLGQAEDSLHDVLSLIRFLIDKVSVPVVAAGGVMDAKSICSALASGASAVQMGTAFLCCDESGISSCYKKTLLNATHDNTTLTRAFSGKLARGVTNEFITRMQLFEKDILDYPIQNALTTAMRKEANRQSNPNFMSMWAGQAFRLCRELPAAQLIGELINEVSHFLLR